jgi:two-component system chemotaxis sensor kinase CheA
MSSLTLLTDTFRQEGTELLAELAKALEAQRGGERDEAALTTARRVAHNLKGAALVVGARPIAELCHFLEDELETARQSEGVSADRVDGWLSIVNDLEKAVDVFQFAETPDTTNEAENPEPAVDPGSAPEATIRVEIRRLDEVMGDLREIAQSQVRLAEQNRVLRAICEELTGSPLMVPGQHAPVARRLATGLQQIQQQTQELGYHIDALSETMNQLRMTPLGAMEALWQRTVRETGREVNRAAQLDVDVGEVEVDIRLYELLKDPLLHILRNALAHGIEPANVREVQGKRRFGKIRVEARTEGVFVRLRVSDDGRGIDPGRVAAQAVQHGWIAADAAARMSDADRRALVFLPGLSTAEVVTTISGRGIGMHSVQRNIEELGGSVTIADKPVLGGTTFEIQIPATVLSVKGLLVQSSGVTYALSLNDVVQVGAVGVAALDRSEGYPVFIDATGRPVRVQTLDALLGKPSAPCPRVVYIVVVRRAGQELALIVDEVIGEREFVTRALPWNLEGTPGINGTLILADGSVALFLDTTAIFAASRQMGAFSQVVKAEPHASPGRILLADDSLSVRMLQTQTLTAAGYEVVACVDGKQAWEMLQREVFDLLVSDVQMPNMDGFELTSRIRNSASLRKLPVILVTSMTSPADVSRGAEVGADEYVTKGQFDQEKLVGAVRRLIK